jgi:hypothetical protein
MVASHASRATCLARLANRRTVHQWHTVNMLVTTARWRICPGGGGARSGTAGDHSTILSAPREGQRGACTSKVRCATEAFSWRDWAPAELRCEAYSCLPESDTVQNRAPATNPDVSSEATGLLDQALRLQTHRRQSQCRTKTTSSSGFACSPCNGAFMRYTLLAAVHHADSTA